MNTLNTSIETMFGSGAHFGLGRSRRNPSVLPYIFTTKNRTDIFDLEKTKGLLDAAKEFVSRLASEGKTILIIGGKKEAANAVKSAGMALNMPYVDGRWIGGTLTNFPQVRKRIDLYEKLVADRERGELGKYTKRERLLIDRDIAKLEKMFLGIASLKRMPDAVFIVDPRHEKNAVNEAISANIPIIALANSDCDIALIKYPVVGNDAAKASIQFFADEISKAYTAGKLRVSSNKP